MVNEEFVAVRGGQLELTRTGRGEPVTLFAHGLGGSIATTRPFSSGVSGTRAFFHFPAHGSSQVVLPRWDYGVLADEVDTVARHVNATRALGVSMGAGAILRLLSENPLRFERTVIVLPAVLDSPRESPGLVRYEQLAKAASDGDIAAIRTQLAAEIPNGVVRTPAVEAWLDDQAASFIAPGMAQALHELPRVAPLRDAETLREVTTPVLILAQYGDDVHPVSSAQRLAELLPNPQLETFDGAGMLWGHRSAVRQVVADFFNGELTAVN